MDYSTDSDEAGWQETGIALDMMSLFDYFPRLADQRCARGKRYQLAQICALATLAKLCGEDCPWGMAQWARERQAVLGPLLQLPRGLPCHNTYRRVLGRGVAAMDLQQHVTAFLCAQRNSGRSVLIAIDGKTLRGTIPSGASQGVHLLAAYLPAEGIVLMQVAVESQENEIVAAPKLLACLDLRGKIVIGDAIQTQRELSAQIIAAEGDYIWFVKDNQPQLHADITEWFAAETHTKGFSPVPKDFQTARSITKGHGRREERTLTTSSLLNDYLDWPGVAQVFQLQRRTVNTHTGEERQQVVYGLTSLSAQAASAERLNRLVRQYWHIENGLHYRRDKTLHEDATRMSNPCLAQNMATLNNLIIALVLRQGWRYLPEARRHYSGCLEDALKLVFGPPG
jgi:predicted transposase YbfD/YdcC